VLAETVNERFHVERSSSSGSAQHSQHALEIVVRIKRDQDSAGLFAAQFDLDGNAQQVAQLFLQRQDVLRRSRFRPLVGIKRDRLVV
jgi:hypothetical protein